MWVLLEIYNTTSLPFLGTNGYLGVREEEYDSQKVQIK
jgi:hypothetical protein